MSEKLIIKHVRFTFDEWNKSILKKSIYQGDYEDVRLGLINIEKVNSPQVWSVFGKKITVADDGYKILIISSKKEDYVITMYMNKSMTPVIWYIDMCDGMGIDDDGVFYYNDIFLDLIISDSNEVVEVDKDEMEQAFTDGVINYNQKRLAIMTAEGLKNKIDSSPDWIYKYSKDMLEVMRNKIVNGEYKIFE